jgi:glyoxylase-like metal-dependent hydrolase (beta-lactamase superfamily II)
LQSAKGFSATASWGNVIQMADLFFNGMYPYIDPGTGGKISGMIAAADKILSLADNDTKIVAGHGPLGNSTPSGYRHHRRRPVCANRLFDVVNPPGEDFLPRDPSIRM